MNLVIPDDLRRAIGMTDEELKLELAVHLLRIGRLTLDQASQLAGVDPAQFHELLGNRQAPVR